MSHPPCEDVSWKTRYRLSANWRQVILLVRMWVEKAISQEVAQITSSSSLWGCELKSERSCIRDYRNGHPPCEDVSWKIVWSCKTLQNYSHPPCEDVSWKVLGPLLFMLVHRHPPCEDVSWKSLCLTFLSRFHWSSSLWGCELKNWLNLYNVRYLLSSSLWGCELKRWWTKFESITWRHPPCEDVSWKVIHHLLCSLYDRHPSCEDVSWKNYIVYLQTKGFVILHVRMWVEKFYHVTL